MFPLDLFKPLAGPRSNTEFRVPWDAFDASKPIDDPALTFKTDADVVCGVALWNHAALHPQLHPLRPAHALQGMRLMSGTRA